jgi:hypothetical protein
MVKSLYLLAVLGGFLIAVTLWAWGQPLICTCGNVKFWEGHIWSAGNSQHVADWYTLSHVVHGIIVILVGRLPKLRLPYPALLLVAVITGVAWEIFEHTDWVLGQFREVTIYQGYIGDSVLNAVMDYVWMWAGFFLARSLPTISVFGLVAVLEIAAAIFGRDSLTLATIQLIYPLDAIEAYQQAINPRANSDVVAD